MSDSHPRTMPVEYSDIEFENNAQRMPLVLCLDTSSSMAGQPIDALNEALRSWTHELHNDVGLSYSVEVAVITFGGQGICAWQGPNPLAPGTRISPFVPAHAFQAPRFTASGVTLLTEALELAMQIVAARKTELRATGLQYYRPQICLVTDGLPTDGTGHYTPSWQRLVPVLAQEQEARRFRLYAIGVGGISDQGEAVLRALAPTFNARLHGFPFKELLQMMSASASAEQRGAGDEVFEKIFSQFRTQRPAWES
ncbi:VWA domain-containing protein [Streptomyces sp. NPDC051940]|uniref:vWA domain-containing protein n=1 Tax=Streptomyces sp. NPDC051940 TaxID=3155675 RepID=UPI003425753F